MIDDAITIAFDPPDPDIAVGLSHDRGTGVGPFPTQKSDAVRSH
jgi:hypothetical protein